MPTCVHPHSPSHGHAATRRPALTPARTAGGFTLVELIVTMILVSILAVVVIPKLGAAEGARADAYRDGLVAGLRYAHGIAQGHRRLVCATINSTTGMTLTIAPANPATSCSTALIGADNNPVYVAPPGSTSTTVTPSAVLYFQPSGTVTSDGAGGTATTFTITPSGQTAITVGGVTGYVQ